MRLAIPLALALGACGSTSPASNGSPDAPTAPVDAPADAAPAAPTCAPTAIPEQVSVVSGGVVALAANCANATSLTWERVTASGPAPAAAGSATTSTVFTGQAVAGTYEYRVTAQGPGGTSAPASVTVTVTPLPTNCVVRDWTEFPTWAPHPGATIETASAPTLSMAFDEIVSMRLPVTENLASRSNPVPPEGTFFGFWINPDPTVVAPTGKVQVYTALGGPYAVSVTAAPCQFPPGYTITNPFGTPILTPTAPLEARCLALLGEQGGLNTLRHDSAMTNAEIEATPGSYCRLPEPDPQGFLYLNLRPIQQVAISGPPFATGCTTDYCFNLLLNSY